MTKEKVHASNDSLESAKAVLKMNDQGSYTIPAQGLYPHQWLWDSCFIAIGIAHYDVKRAQAEIESILRGQWSNGMVPHMVFDSGLSHQRDREIWRSYISPYSPDHLATSGITQPPLLAESIVQIGKGLSKAERHKWYRKLYPALLRYHTWLYSERDPKDSGLTVQLHSWETGLDSTPSWMSEIHANLPWWIKLIRAFRLDSLINFVRRDTNFTLPGQRLTNIDAIALYNAQNQLRRRDYDIQKILKGPSVLIEDLAFNCILVRANQLIADIAQALGEKLPAQLTTNIEKSQLAIEQLWDESVGRYYSRNFKTGNLIAEPTIATLLPLYAGCISKERADQLVKLMRHKNVFGSKYPLPSVPLNSPWFAEHRYWQGPVWINMNWLIADGLERYKFPREAKMLRDTSLELVGKHGCYEYFSPLDGSPAGAPNFSWTAALAIDFMSKKD